MIKKTFKRRVNSLIPALVVLCAALLYVWTEGTPPGKAPQTVLTEQKGKRNDSLPEKVVVPDKGDAVRLLTMNTANYFVPEDPRRTDYLINYKPLEAREAVAELIHQSDAEIVGLCEMGGEAAVKDLQARLKKRGVRLPHQAIVVRDGEDRCLALLSKFPIVKNNSVRDVLISGQQGEGKMMLRGILDVTIALPDSRQFRLVGVHLKSQINRNGSAENTRRQEAYALREYLNQVIDSQEGMPMLLYGDFNNGPTGKSVQIIQGPAKTTRRLNRLKPVDSRGETWTIYYGMGDIYQAFDHIFLNNTLKKRLGTKPSMGILDSSLSQKASDHRGVWVDLK